MTTGYLIISLAVIAAFLIAFIDQLLRILDDYLCVWPGRTTPMGSDPADDPADSPATTPSAGWAVCPRCGRSDTIYIRDGEHLVCRQCTRRIS